MELNEPLIDWLITSISGGASQAELAKALSVNAGDLSVAINRCDAETLKRFAGARATSAEAWLDRGMDAIEKSLLRDVSMYDPSAARAYAQECARRAAIRNPAYRDKSDVNVQTPPGQALRVLAATLTAEQAAAAYKDLME